MRSAAEVDAAALQSCLDRQVTRGGTPGAVAVIAREVGGAAEIVTSAVAGRQTLDGPSMALDSRFRIASLGKPIVAAAALALVERGGPGLDDPVARWLPELTSPQVLRRPDGELEDLVPATRPITVRDLLASQNGHGFPARMDAPIVTSLLGELHQGPPRPQEIPPAGEWLRRLAGVPMVHQPGEGWSYNTAFDILGVLLERATDQDLGAVLEEAILTPLGMHDTAFHVPAEVVPKLTGLYAHDGPEGDLILVDPPDGQWTSPPAFRAGSGGLISTAGDWLAFGRMLLSGGLGPRGRILSDAHVRMMMRPQATAEPDNLFLGGHAWGFGGSVDVAVRDPWNVPGRYGWVGGTGTAGYVIPSTRTIVIWLSQVEMAGPEDFSAMAEVLTVAASPPR